jgi:DNA-binding PadR family transcriptional regulator
MGANTDLDRRVLRALRAEPVHGYALAQVLALQGGPDRATVYRRLQALARRGLVRQRSERGDGPPRKVWSLTGNGEEALRAELRDAMRLLLEAFDTRSRAGGGDGGAEEALRGPLVFVSGSRISGVELRILATMAEALPRRVHLVLPPGVPIPGGAPAGVAVVEAPWTALPFRDGYAGVVMVNELPAARVLVKASREWARVLAGDGVLHVIAPRPLPRGIEPFVDFLAELHDELYADQAGGPQPEQVTSALQAAFDDVGLDQESNQLVWTARRAK